jgi:hypothetical protein
MTTATALAPLSLASRARASSCSAISWDARARAVSLENPKGPFPVQLLQLLQAGIEDARQGGEGGGQEGEEDLHQPSHPGKRSSSRL